MAPAHPTFIVTGGAAGIGLETVRGLRDHGHDVVVLDVRRPPLDDVRYVETDLGDPDSIDSSVAELADDSIAGLANVAGVSGRAGSTVTLSINFLGLRHLTNALIDRFTATASVVNVASFAGVGWRDRLDRHLALASTPTFEAGIEWLAENPVPDDFGYPYSKEVLRVWSRLQAARWLHSGRRMNTVSPGPVETAILSEFVQTLGKAKVDEDIVRVGRAGTPRDIAPVITWLLGSESAWVNGADIPLDGGLDASFFGVRS